MGEAAPELQLHIMNSKEEKAQATTHHPNVSPSPKPKSYRWWLRVALYSLFIISGQAVATLLGRLYYDQGGNSTWLATVVQLAGFPILIPYYFIFFKPKSNTPDTASPIVIEPPSLRMLVFVYGSLGALVAADCYLYSVGLLYLPVSTYSLICASQLAFNAVFSFFLNRQKFTPYILNSLVLLTISSTLLVFQSDSENPTGVSKAKYAVGFVCTVAASAGYGLVLSLTQLAFTKVLKKDTIRAVMNMIFYQSVVAVSITVVGLFASGQWKGLPKEMAGYKKGKVSYLMNLTWTAISWQIFSIGAVGLIFDVSSLFSNALSVLGLPVVPVLAVVFFHDKMEGIKVVAMILAIWGFISYVYQHYLDDSKLKNAARLRESNEASISAA